MIGLWRVDHRCRPSAPVSLDVRGLAEGRHTFLAPGCRQDPQTVPKLGGDRGTPPLHPPQEVTMTRNTPPRDIQPGDLVHKIGTDLDDREVIGVGRDWIIIDILGQESPRLPKDNYEVTVPAEGQF